MNNSENIFPAVLKRLRGTKSQAELARLCGIPQSSYTRYESGAIKPKHDALCKIAMHFDMSVDELCAGAESKRQPEQKPDLLALHEKFDLAIKRMENLEKEFESITELNRKTNAEIEYLRNQLSKALDRIPKPE